MTQTPWIKGCEQCSQLIEENERLKKELGEAKSLWRADLIAAKRLRDETSHRSRLHAEKCLEQAERENEKLSADLQLERDCRKVADAELLKAERERAEAVKAAAGLRGQRDRFEEEAARNLANAMQAERERDVLAKSEPLGWAEVAAAEAEVLALRDFAAHDSKCIRSLWSAGQPTENGGYEMCYAGKWYESKPVDRTPKCDCGLDALLKRYEEGK